MHGYAIPTREAIDFCEDMRKTKKLRRLAGIEEWRRPRREVLPYGALVLERLLKTLDPSEVLFSVFGIREGLLYSPAVRRTSAARTRCSRSAPSTPGCARARSSTPGAVQVDRRAVRAARPQGDGRGAAPAPCRLPALRHRLARAPRLSRRAEPQPDLAHAGARPASTIRAACSWRSPSIFRHVGAGARSDARRAVRAPEGASFRSGSEARAHHRRGHPRRAHAVDRPGRRHRRDAAELRGQQAGPDRFPRPTPALDGERLRRRFEALAQLLEQAPEIRIGR